MIADALALSSRIPTVGLPSLGLTLRDCSVGEARCFLMWLPYSSMKPQWIYVWQVIRMTKTDFGIALIRIRSCRKGSRDQISSNFVLPFVWFTRAGSFEL